MAPTPSTSPSESEARSDLTARIEALEADRRRLLRQRRVHLVLLAVAVSLPVHIAIMIWLYFSEVEGPRPLFIERVLYDVDGAAAWCDVDKTVREESCAEIAKIALDDALDELTEAYGEEVDTWRWGEAHIARHGHTPLGAQWPFSLFVNIEHETSGGDYTLLRAQTRGSGPEPYRNVHAAGYRAVYDFADLDRSVHIIATGQSGHMLSRHYDDLAELWRSGQYIPMTMNRDDVEAGALGITRLSPPTE